MPTSCLRIFTLISLLLLSACGWQLRGADSASAAPNLERLRLDAAKTSNVAPIVRDLFILNDIDTGPQKPQIVIQISNEEFTSRVAAVDSVADASVYRITLSVILTIKDAEGHVLLKPTEIKQSGNYDYDKNAASSMDRVEDQVNQRLEQHVASIIQRRTFAIFNKADIR